MKFLVSALWMMAVAAVPAQVDFPGNPTVGPKKYTTRPVGGGTDPGAKLEGSTEAPPVRYTTHLVLFDSRWWTNREGKPLEAKLIAFEDLVGEAAKGSPEPKMSAPPAHPTVVRDGRIRLLVNRKPVEVALASLSRQDQEFVGQIQEALAKKAAAGR